MSFKNDNLNYATRGANSLGNFFLTPVRYTLGGKSGTCFFIPTGIIPFQLTGGSVAITGIPLYGSIEQKRANVIKTVFAIIFFIPSLILGVLFKAPALLGSSRLRRRHVSFSELNNTKEKALHALRIGIATREVSHIDDFIRYASQTADSEAWFSEPQEDSDIFTDGASEVSFARFDADKLSKLCNRTLTPQQYLATWD